MKRSKHILLSMALSLNFCAPVYADDVSLSYAVSHLVGGYGVSELKDTPFSLFCNEKSCPDSLYNQAISVIHRAITPTTPADQVSPTAPLSKEEQKKIQTQTGGVSYTDQAIYNLLTATDKTAGLMVSSMAGLNVPMPLPQDPAFLATFKQRTPEGQSIFSTAPLSLDTLLQPLQYNKQQTTDAQNYIIFLSGLAAPAATIDFSQLSADVLKTELQSSTMQQYLVTLRSTTANYAVAISNLYQLYAERMPMNLQQLVSQQGLALPQGVSLPSTLQPNASQLAFDQYMATRRFSPGWQSFIDGTSKDSRATPAELQRQTIYLLREIHYELYKSRLQNERILATLSAMQIQSAGNNQLTLNNMLRQLCSQDSLKAGCPAGSTTGAPSISSASKKLAKPQSTIPS